MFRFWSSDSRGSKATATTPDSVFHESAHSQSAKDSLKTVAQPHKRRRQHSDADDEALNVDVVPKKAKLDDSMREQIGQSMTVMDCCETAEERIESAFQLQILLKHEEKRLIDLQLAKCQTALEQLRRVHLKPYPINCPTPEQMLDISAGKGHALQHPGKPVPKYAPPYGVVDGPYSRHYERWLIPHPDFDGVEYEMTKPQQVSLVTGAVSEGRSSRNHYAPADGLSTRGRPGRSAPSAKLQALHGEKPVKKGTSGPCILKRSDGQTVKLVCLYCNRSDFNSTQGFINHVRIAHKHEFKSHDEAAMKSGQPLESGDADAAAAAVGNATAAGTAATPSNSSVDERAPAVQAPRHTIFVNSLARDDMSYQEACVALSARLADTLKAYNEGKLPRAGNAQAVSHDKASAQSTAAVKSSTDAPYLSRLLLSKNISENLDDLVGDARTQVALDDVISGDESEDGESSAANTDEHEIPARKPVVKRVPACSAHLPASASGRPTSSKSRSLDVHSSELSDSVASRRSNSRDEDVVMEEPSLSPSTLISNNAPSLVSDDGEYDDSDDGSSVSGESEGPDDAQSVSDVAEINLDEEHEPRTIRRSSTGISSAVRLRRDDPKHVSFVSPITNKPNTTATPISNKNNKPERRKHLA